MINSNHLILLEKALDASSMRQRVIADNIANVDTPHYKSKEVSFESHLQQAMQSDSKFKGYRTDPRHIEIGQKSRVAVQPEIVVRKGTVMNNNGNNVDIDYEVTKMAKNALWYQSLIQQTGGYFNRLRSAIEGRGR
ncbi:MAG: flagellar basal body rod protein FlgB [Bacillaceae bacterium]|nr:flagellar basal body rod protein FlgB [Bacillaceae bacterium]